MARGRSSVGDEMEHVCASCRGRRAPATGRPTPDYRATNPSKRSARSSKPFAASGVSAGGERARRRPSRRRAVRGAPERPRRAGRGVAVARDERAVGGAELEVVRGAERRRGADGEVLAVDARVSRRRWGRGAVRGAPAKLRARLDTRSAVGDQLAALVDAPRRAPLELLPLEEVEGAPGQRQ